jgi:hypothetical protein
VLREEKVGQVHGMELLPIPTQVYGSRTHHFKDINIVSLDGSSSDVETHMGNSKSILECKTKLLKN